MNTQIIAAIAKNIGRLSGAAWCDRSTSNANARYIAESCLAAIERHKDVVVAEEYILVAERRLEANAVTFPTEVKKWAESCIRDTRAFMFAAENSSVSS